MQIESQLAPFTEKPIFEFSIPLIDQQIQGINLDARNDLVSIMKDFIQRKIPYETARDKFLKIAGNASPVEKIRDVLQMQDQPIHSSNDGIGDDSDSKLRRKMQKWSVYEDNRLLAAIYRYGIDNWALISKFVGNNRTRAQCAQRWTRCLNPRICKDTWDQREDALLIQLVQRYGDHSWTKVAELMGNRSDVQCRYRYSQISKEMMGGNEQQQHRVAFPTIQAPKAMDSEALQLQTPKVMDSQFQHRYSMPVIQVIHTYIYQPQQMNGNQQQQQQQPIVQQQLQNPTFVPQTSPQYTMQPNVAFPPTQLDDFLTQFQH